MTESEAAAAAVEIAQPQPFSRCVALAREEIGTLADLERQCCGDRSRGFLWWRGVVAEDASDPTRRGACYNFAAIPKGQQRQLIGGAAWTRIGFAPNGQRQWRLESVFVHPDHRGGGVATSLLNGTPLDFLDYEVIADVGERQLVVQKLLRSCGWHAFPLTKLDGNGTIRFRADFAGCRELVRSAQRQQKQKRRRDRRPPQQTQGAAK